MWQLLRQWFIEPGNLHLSLGVFSAVAAGVVLGWLIWSRKGRSESNRLKGDKAFFKGIHYILSNERDHAIEEFTKSVQVDSDTIETYIALGNLYRSKGDIDRAIRIRQSIILRPNIDRGIRLQALFDLGLDYKKGGFLNRALETFLKVVQEDSSSVETLTQMERIYEEMKDWENAYKTRRRISRLSKGNHRHILAHHLVEMGKSHQEKGDLPMAKSLYHRAISIYKECVDAYLHLGDLYFAQQEYRNAISTWKTVVEVAPQFTFLSYGRLEMLYYNMKDRGLVESFLRECGEMTSDAFIHLALARYLYIGDDPEGALRELDEALELDPWFLEAKKFRGEILSDLGRDKEAVETYEDLIGSLNVSYLRFQCEKCGFEPAYLQWQCPSCKNWDTINLIDSGILGARRQEEGTREVQGPHQLPEGTYEE